MIEISTNYDLEIENLVSEINSNNYKLILLQFPDGFKHYSKKIVDYLRENTKSEYIIYFGSCFGACDVPIHLDKIGFDLCVQWGHNEFIKKKEMW